MFLTETGNVESRCRNTTIFPVPFRNANAQQAEWLTFEMQ